MNHPTPDRPDRIDDILALYCLVKITPGLPMPTVSPCRATFDYRHVVHEQDAREFTARAVHNLLIFGVPFGERTETDIGNGAPVYLLEAPLPSGLTLVIVSRVSQTADAPELAGVAA
jgi:hypothetical protein